jgi:8-oxo-dGTP diphosphatase
MDQLVVGALITDDLQRPSRVLAARRTGPPALAGRWEFPGGKVELGESAEAALHRELAEELGVSVHLGAELQAPGAVSWPLTRGLVMRTWWCVLAGGAPHAGPDHDDLRWVSAGDIEELDWLDPDRPIVELVVAALL